MIDENRLGPSPVRKLSKSDSSSLGIFLSPVAEALCAQTALSSPAVSRAGRRSLNEKNDNGMMELTPSSLKSKSPQSLPSLHSSGRK